MTKNFYGGEGLTDLERRTIIDVMDAAELVDLLEIPIEDIVSAFEERIAENIEELSDLTGLYQEEENDDNDEE